MERQLIQYDTIGFESGYLQGVLETRLGMIRTWVFHDETWLFQTVFRQSGNMLCLQEVARLA